MVAAYNLNNRLIAGLQQLIASGIDLPLVPIGTHKQPLGDNWQNRPYSAAQLIEAINNGGIDVPIKGEIKKLPLGGIGVITGLPVTVEGITYYLMALDQDGESAIALIDELSNGAGVPQTVAFASGRPGRCQYLLLVPQQYKNLIRTKKLKTGMTGDDGKPEQLEFRWSNMQSVLPPSVHPTTGGYHWVGGAALGEVPIAFAPQWVLSQMLIEPQPEAKTREIKPSTESKVKVHANQWTDVDWALSYLSALSPSRADDYDDWLAVGMALQSVDESLLREWDNWSRSSTKYKPGECEKKWKSFSSSGGVSLGTLAHLAKTDGWRSPSENNRNHFVNSGKTLTSQKGEQACSPQAQALREVPKEELSLAAALEEILDRNLDSAAQDLALVELAKSYDNYNPSEIRAIANKLIDVRHQQDYLSERKTELEQLEARETSEYSPFDDIFYDCPDAARAFKHLCQINPKIQPQYFLGILPIMGSLIGIKGEVVAPVLGQVKGTLNVALVGESGEGKSIVSKILIRPLFQLQKEIREQHLKQTREYEKAVENWNRQHPDYRGVKPSQSEYITTTDAFLVISEYSREGIVRNHVDNPNGLLIYQEEMVALQRAQNMYRQGKGDDRQFLNNLYDNGPIARGLKNERSEVTESAVSLFGGYQPSIVLGEMGDLSDPDGQWARFNFVFGIEKKVHTSLKQPTVDLSGLLYDLYRRAFLAPPVKCQFDEGGLELLEKFVNEMEDARWSCLEPGMRAVYSKASSEVMRLALDLHWMNCLLKGVPVSPIIPAIAIRKAIKIKRFFLSQIAIIRAWGKGSPLTEEGLAPLYRQMQKLAARLEGVEEVLTTRRVLSARLPIFNGLKAKDIEKIFKDMAAMGKATLVNWKRGIALSISSLLDGIDKSRKPSPTPDGGSRFPNQSDDDYSMPIKHSETSDYNKGQVAITKNTSSNNSSSVVLPVWGNFAQTALGLLKNNYVLQPSLNGGYGLFAESAETAGGKNEQLFNFIRDLPAPNEVSAKEIPHSKDDPLLNDEVKWLLQIKEKIEMALATRCVKVVGLRDEEEFCELITVIEQKCNQCHATLHDVCLGYMEWLWNIFEEMIDLFQEDAGRRQQKRKARAKWIALQEWAKWIIVLQTTVEENTVLQTPLTEVPASKTEWIAGQVAVHNGVKVVIDWLVNTMVAKVRELESDKRYEVAIALLKPIVSEGGNAAQPSPIPQKELSLLGEEMIEVVERVQLDIFSSSPQPL